MKNPVFILMIAAIVISIIFEVLIHFFRKRGYKKSLHFLETKKYNEFDRYLDGKLAKLIFPPYNRNLFKLNSHILRQKKDLVLADLKEFSKMKLDKKQLTEVYLSSFNYFLEIADARNARTCLKKIEGKIDDQDFSLAKKMYEIYFEKSYAYLDEMLDSLREDINISQKIMTLYLISLMYENKGDKKSAQKFKEMAKNVSA